MRKALLITTIAIATVAVIGTAVQAQPYGPGMMGDGGSGPGPGMMGQGYGGGYGSGMMGQGYGGGYGPGMMQGYGPGPGYGQGYGPGYGRGGFGAGMGNRGYYQNQAELNLSTDDVSKFLARMIRNPNLKVGAVKEKDADTITAEIVTKDKDALVQRFEFNRHNGYYQAEQ